MALQPFHYPLTRTPLPLVGIVTIGQLLMVFVALGVGAGWGFASWSGYHVSPSPVTVLPLNATGVPPPPPPPASGRQGHKDGKEKGGSNGDDSGACSCMRAYITWHPPFLGLYARRPPPPPPSTPNLILRRCST